MGERGRRCSATYIYMHMNTNDENIWIAIEDKDVWQDERRGLDVGAEWAGAVVGAAEQAGPCRRGGDRRRGRAHYGLC